MRVFQISLLIALLLSGIDGAARAGVVISPTSGFVATWNGNDGDQAGAVPDNLALASNGAMPFSSGALGPELGLGFHLDANINDGSYGNAMSWIGGNAPSPPYFIGAALGAVHEIRAVAWGRDNTGSFSDRSLGVYTLQITTDAVVGPGTVWTTVATFDYQSDDDGIPGGAFTSSLRHEYGISTATLAPLVATAVRLLVPSSGTASGTAVDELEVLATPVSAALKIVPAPGFDVTWNGNDGDQSGGVPDNLALQNGATAFSSGDLGPELGLGYHLASNVNDGLYGGPKSWIGSSAATPPFFIGLDLGGAQAFRAVAWGRDNTDSFIDRTLGTYVLQITNDALPSAGGAWSTLATFTLLGNEDTVRGGNFTAHLRHEYRVSTDVGDAVVATGVRLIVPESGVGGGTAVDELEVLTDGVSQGLVITPAAGFVATWDGNEGEPQLVQNNLALASNGATAFSSGDLGVEQGLGFHLAENVNDGLYGGPNSWIGGDAPALEFFIAVDLGDLAGITSVAWGRDNSGAFIDRAIGTYLLQITSDPAPNAYSAWSTVASFDYRGSEDSVRGGLFTPSYRHEYDVRTDLGQPIEATAVRLRVPFSGVSAGTAVDELEVFGPTSVSLVSWPLYVLLPLTAAFLLGRRGS